jgi:hypothetical protein
MLRGDGALFQLVDGPFLPGLGVAAHFRCGEGVEDGVVGRVDGHQLALQVRRQLGDLDSRLAADAGDLVAIIFRCRRLAEIEQSGVPGGDLDALVAERGGPFGDRFQRIERRRVAAELGEKDRRSLHRLHAARPLFR